MGIMGNVKSIFSEAVPTVSFIKNVQKTKIKSMSNKIFETFWKSNNFLWCTCTAIGKNVMRERVVILLRAAEFSFRRSLSILPGGCKNGNWHWR